MKKKQTRKLQIKRSTLTNLDNGIASALRGGGFNSNLLGQANTCANTQCNGNVCILTQAATCGFQCETLAQTACQPCLATVDPYYCSAQCTQITCAPCIDPA
jgi:hypothetical protein